jgi:hypothetical protein
MLRVALCIFNEGYVLYLGWRKGDLFQIAFFTPVPFFGGKVFSEIALPENISMAGIYFVHHYAHTPDRLMLNIAVGKQAFGTLGKLARVAGGWYFPTGCICFLTMGAAFVLSYTVCNIADSEQAGYR